MRVNIHDDTPSSKFPPKNNSVLLRILRIAYAIGITLIIFIFLLLAITVILEGEGTLGVRIAAGIIVFALPFALGGLFYVFLQDMEKSHAQTTVDTVVVTEYFLGFKRIKTILCDKIDKIQTYSGYNSKCGRAWRYAYYVLFLDSRGKRLFKVIATPAGQAFANEVSRIIKEETGREVRPVNNTGNHTGWYYERQDK